MRCRCARTLLDLAIACSVDEQALGEFSHRFVFGEGSNVNCFVRQLLKRFRGVQSCAELESLERLGTRCAYISLSSVLLQDEILAERELNRCKEQVRKIGRKLKRAKATQHLVFVASYFGSLRAFIEGLFCLQQLRDEGQAMVSPFREVAVERLIIGFACEPALFHRLAAKRRLCPTEGDEAELVGLIQQTIWEGLANTWQPEVEPYLRCQQALIENALTTAPPYELLDFLGAMPLRPLPQGDPPSRFPKALVENPHFKRIAEAILNLGVLPAEPA